MKAIFKRRLLKLADAVEHGFVMRGETKPVKFDMAYWKDRTRATAKHCGTVACIGGHAELMFGTDNTSRSLGLMADEADLLFYPIGFSFRGAKRFTRAKVAATIRHFVKTGQIIFTSGVLQ